MGPRRDMEARRLSGRRRLEGTQGGVASSPLCDWGGRTDCGLPTPGMGRPWPRPQGSAARRRWPTASGRRSPGDRATRSGSVPRRRGPRRGLATPPARQRRHPPPRVVRLPPTIMGRGEPPQRMQSRRAPDPSRTPSLSPEGAGEHALREFHCNETTGIRTRPTRVPSGPARPTSAPASSP